MCLDFDHVDNIGELKQQLLNHEYFDTELLFVSPSGNGLKWIIPVDLKGWEHSRHSRLLPTASKRRACHQVAMDCQVCQRLSPEMVSAIHDLSGIANNVNQIAHQMHIYGLGTVKQQCFSIISEVGRIITQVKNTCHDSED